HALALLVVARPAEHHAEDRLEVHLRWLELLRRGANEGVGPTAVLRRLLHVLAHETEHLRTLRRVGDEHAAVDHRPHLVQPEHERRDDPEVAAAAADAPVEVRVLARAALDETAVGRDHVRGEEVVAGQAALALEPATAAPERE